MTVKDLEVLYDYGYWANGKLFNVISQLTPEQFSISFFIMLKSWASCVVNQMHSLLISTCHSFHGSLV